MWIILFLLYSYEVTKEVSVEVVQHSYASNWHLFEAWLNLDEFLTTFFTILSSFLYIPIVINIRKNRHLPSVKISKPQKYILYQTILISFAQLWKLVAMVYTYTRLKEHTITTRESFASSDIWTMPVLVQLTYLMCNRRNMRALRRQATYFKTWKLLILDTFGKRPQVSPDPAIPSIMATTVAPQ